MNKIGKLGCGGLIISFILALTLESFGIKLGSAFFPLTAALLVSAWLAFNLNHLQDFLMLGLILLLVNLYFVIMEGRIEINFTLSLWLWGYLIQLGSLAITLSRKENDNTPEEKEPEQPMRQ